MNLTEQEIVSEFLKREKIVTRYFLVSAVLVLVYLVLFYLVGFYINPAIPFIIVFGLIFGSLYKYYRCPKCNSLPKGLGVEGVQLAPKDCGMCGCRLR